MFDGRLRPPVIAFLAILMLVLPAASAQARVPSILVYGPTLRAVVPNEQSIMEDLGYDVTVADEATWSSMTTSEFEEYDVLVFGDPDCGTDVSILDTAVATESTWAPAVTDSMAMVGVDPIRHLGVGQFAKLTSNAISFAAHGNGTGLYASLSCYYYLAPVGTPVELLAAFGEFEVQGQYTPPFNGCPTQVGVSERGARHPVLRGISADGLENGTCTIHEAFDAFPQDFGDLAHDADFHIPYIIATAPRG